MLPGKAQARHHSMMRHHFSALRPMLLLVLCLLALPAAQGQVSHTEQEQGVNITLAYNKTHLEVGEPIILKITLENVTREPIVEFNCSFQFPLGNGITVQVQPPQELQYHYDGGLEPGNYSQVSLSLYPNRPVSVDALLLYDRTQPSGFLFSTPGTWYLTTTLNFHMRGGPEMYKVTLPTTDFHVTPASGLHAQAMAQLASADLVRALQVSAAPTTGVLDALARLAQEYPATALGALAGKAAGTQYALMESVNPPDRLHGAELLTRYLATGTFPYESDRVALTIIGAYHLAGQQEMAREWIQWLLRTYPHSPYISPYDAMIGYYYSDPARYASEVPWYLMKEPWKIPGAPVPQNLNPRKEVSN